MQRMHPEDLRTLIVAIIHASPKVTGTTLDWSIDRADDLLAHLAKTAKPEAEEPKQTSSGCPICRVGKGLHSDWCPRAPQDALLTKTEKPEEETPMVPDPKPTMIDWHADSRFNPALNAAITRAEKAEEKLKAIAFAFQVEGVDLAAEARALKARIKELEALDANRMERLGWWHKECADRQTRIEELEAALTEARARERERLKPWLAHSRECIHANTREFHANWECICGLCAALEPK